MIYSLSKEKKNWDLYNAYTWVSKNIIVFSMLLYFISNLHIHIYKDNIIFLKLIQTVYKFHYDKALNEKTNQLIFIKKFYTYSFPEFYNVFFSIYVIHKARMRLSFVKIFFTKRSLRIFLWRKKCDWDTFPKTEQFLKV